MLSILDSYSLQYMLEQFPRTIIPDLWNIFEEGCEDGTIISERETRKKLENEASETQTLEWCKKYSSLFKSLKESEAKLLGNMMNAREFDIFNNSQLLERRLPEGMPFIICMAKVQKRNLVYRKNTEFLTSIIKLCDKYEIDHLEIEEYLLKLKKRIKKTPN